MDNQQERFLEMGFKKIQSSVDTWPMLKQISRNNLHRLSRKGVGFK